MHTRWPPWVTKKCMVTTNLEMSGNFIFTLENLEKLGNFEMKPGIFHFQIVYFILLLKSPENKHKNELPNTVIPLFQVMQLRHKKGLVLAMLMRWCH